jgi:hypothetical protein
MRHVLLGWVVAAAGGCSGSVEPAPAGPNPIPETSFAEAYADAYCAYTSCCAAGALAANPTCREDVIDYVQQQMAGAEATGAIYDEVAAASCVHDLRVQTQGCPSWKARRDWPPACERLYHDKGTLADQPCTSIWQCADVGDAIGQCFTVVTQDGTESRCQLDLEQERGEGETCSTAPGDATLVCTLPLLCNEEWICRQRYGPGEACSSSGLEGDLCVDGYVCDRKATKQCVKAKQPGEACSASEECELYACFDGTCRWSAAPPFALACAQP